MGYEKLTDYTKNLFPTHLTCGCSLLAGSGRSLSLLRRHRVGMFLAIMAVALGPDLPLRPPGPAVERPGPALLVPVPVPAGRRGHRRGRGHAGRVPQPGRLLDGAALVAARRSQWLHGARRWSGSASRCGSCRSATLTPVPASTAGSGSRAPTGRSSPTGSSGTTAATSRRARPGENEYFALVKTMSDARARPERLRPGHVGVRARARPDGHARRPDAAARTGPTAASARWRACTSSRRRPRRTTSSTPPSCRCTAVQSRSAASTIRARPTWPRASQHLQMLGVKYYMALTPETQAQADADSELRLVATSGPWPVTYYTGNTGVDQAADLEDLRGRQLRPRRAPAQPARW